MDVEGYKRFLAEMVIDYRREVMGGIVPTIQSVVSVLNPNLDNRVIRDLCVELKIATKSEFDQEMRRERQRVVLGVAPGNATELVDAFVERNKLQARYDGLLTRSVPAEYRPEKGEVAQPITAADRADPLIDLYAVFRCDSRNRLNRLDLERELRVLNANLRIGLQEGDIRDAVDEWLQEAQRERLLDIYSALDTRDNGFDAGAAWIELAERVFDCSEHGSEFIAAVLRKFCWQIKRKLLRMPVDNHLMPVILGPQGIGKSTFVNLLLGPIDELRLNVDFRMVTDERNVEIWSSYALFLDEMGYASKADIEVVKNVITASTLTRRPMRSNGKVTIDQRATLIGCSNRELGQLIRDPTGIRRFCGIRMRPDADHHYINNINWRCLWGYVDVKAGDPLAPFRDVLASEQEATRERGRVEQWMFDFDGTNSVYQLYIGRTGWIEGKNLYLAYRDYEDVSFPGAYKTSKVDWDYEMTRIKRNQPDSMVFAKDRRGSGIAYRWNGASEPLPTLVNFPVRAKKIE